MNLIFELIDKHIYHHKIKDLKKTILKEKIL